MDQRHLHIRSEIPQVNIPFVVDAAEKTRVRRVPVHVIYVVIAILKTPHIWLLFWRPQLQTPVERGRENKSRQCRILAAWIVDTDASYWAVVSLVGCQFLLVSLTMECGLIHESIFSSEVEIIDVAFWELSTCDIDICLPSKFSMLHWGAKRLDVPATQFSIIGYWNDVVGNLSTHDVKTVNWVLMACARKTRSLNRQWLSSEIPQQ